MPDTVSFLVDPLPVGATPEFLEASFREIEPGSGALAVNDLAPHRGDGVFETLAIVDGHVQEVEPHLARLANSAQLCELPEPNLDQWRLVITRAAERVPGQGEFALKLALSRGIDPGTTPTGWVHVTPGADFRAAREEGIRVVTLDRGVARGAGERAPWLLLGAKTLSYAANMAAIREAKRRGADDAVFTSSDGYVLEGPTSSVIARFGDDWVTPPPAAGILHGTTQRSIFAHLHAQGRTVEYRDLTVDDLRRADAAWLVSSVRMAAPIVELDGAPMPVDHAATAQLNAYLLGPRD
ncbi:aminodeoxychorismate lyase [Agromyces aurantiacus]|uniref:Aminodeoxychorismate lyase n=1 Tax=Agromyces aurantiacus TaxID=165814 RepID=A0ABV9QZD5_9MICO|nr:aminodeoxychorismate lyase [Agromyces aurantiacus]MBM7505558.1 4-amino-4-deoxychorismate lyase [Agromyces aurantiacus]